MGKQWFCAVAKYMLKSGQKMVTAKKEPVQEETQHYPKLPAGGYFAEFGFLLGPAPFWR